MAPSAALGTSIPALTIPARVELPKLPVLENHLNLTMNVIVIRGPGDNTSDADPYISFTGRVYNDRLVAGVVRAKQGSVLRTTVCNSLPAAAQTINSTFNFGVSSFPLTGGQSYKDPNILAHHFHGHYGSPGTDGTPCDPPPADGTKCFRGDNIFADINPGECIEYQYDIPAVHSPGSFWMHPHHHGSGTLQTQSASVPVIVDPNPAGGWDFLATPSCQRFQPLFQPEFEVIMHMQTFMMAVNGNDTGLPDPSPGPTDDGYIAVAAKSIPQDPFCCEGPDKLEDGMGSWAGSGGANSTGDDWDPTVSQEAFYVSGQNAQFTVINGVYSPIITMKAGQVYRWRMVQASTMKWMDVTFNDTGCHFGIYMRDGNFLRDFPRLTDHIVMSAANRVDVMVVCEPGVYSLRTGAGPLGNDPDCGSSHCKLLTQDNLATIVVSAEGGYPVNSSAPFGTPSCQPVFPPYLSDLRNVAATKDSVTSITYSGLVNFTNGDPTGPASGNCLINSLLYNEGAPLQEVIGEVTQLDVDNIDQHPYHHHTQPYQIVSLPNDTDALNSLWRVGDYVDTLLLPSSGIKTATVRWIPGPVEITGTGYALLHCHILPHSDEGCVMKTQLLEKTYVPVSKGLSNGAKVGITLAALVGIAVLIVLPIVLLKQRKAARRRAAEPAEARAALVAAAHDPEVGTNGIH
ncbi:probable multicopper oxidase LPR1 homolog 3 at C-terminar half [Coccomyxa sp. Obi]|nr:probable multicopper oxidase LPR1 homolog 3 at C-terminar half [Coccomyxa sp. Obi]